MSIFSPRSSSTTAPTRPPRGPTQAPTGSIFSSVACTASFVREPASRADGLDLDETGFDLGNVQFKQPLDQTRMGPGDDDLRAAVCAVYLDDIDSDEVTFPEDLAVDLLPGAQQRVGPVIALADADGHIAG